MDKFTSTVKSQVFPLSCLDSYSSCVTIPLYYFFENKNGDSQFMPSILLRDSFYTTLQEFPFFTGHLRMDTGGVDAYVDIDRDNLNMPDYAEYSSDVCFGDLKAANFSPSALPREISEADIFSTGNKDGVVKLIQIKIARLRNNSGIAILASPVHALSDAYGFCEFMKRWSLVCKEAAAGGVENTDQNISNNSTLLTDRKLLYDSLPKEGQPLDETTAMVLGKKSMLSVLLAWLSPEKRAEFLNTVTPCALTENHVFYLSSEKLRALKETVGTTDVASGTRLSSNDIITAVLSMVSVQSNQVHDGDTDDETIIVNFPVDFRKRLENSNMVNYTGNCVVAPLLPFQYKELRAEINDESLATCAVKVRRLVDLVTPNYVRQSVDLISSEPDCIMRGAAHSSSISSGFCLSNHSRIDYYGVDFGYGNPVWINPPKVYVPNYATILPTSTYNGGCYVYLSLLKGDMERALRHKFWCSIAELVN
ncbi:hypothetical protein IW140_004164 [Coemansia sp. RSA 1813]|nr:hypothetical protein EV178_002291 [Coemansia sp. RSA 1646]KAJ1769571.1 hypothetical protein LPJ74_003933 [Coemansia sp. RSA 1843]KAJ2090051.1 hypothetical protein IW138_003021 [Coemansia sp. RSA 986]KAJ2216990.1 hypothetical protein EV179_000756 [Coemansia sp. RSA 487]KAJ2568076.1 hypothetical protein IW140_004164 [Coemansia sp. RSA 1813]